MQPGEPFQQAAWSTGVGPASACGVEPVNRRVAAFLLPPAHCRTRCDGGGFGREPRFPDGTRLPDPAHLPPADEAGQREWLEGFQQAHADDPNEPFDPDNPESGETAADALRCMLAGNPQLPALLALF